ncbi:ABC transporter permease, partial [Verrucomicrobia bacterium]|nr:ABC transporter permease [Verrucomicrobiota bacterium]
TAFIFFLYVTVFTELGSFDSTRMGSNLLILISTISFVYSLFAGVFYTSDCLSAERRNGTMGLLFLTRLKSYDVTAGKLTAHSLSSIYGLVATIPILALSVLFGGVTDQQFVRTVLALFNCLFLSLSVGLLASSLFLEAKKTMTFTVLILGCLCFAPFFIGRVLNGLFNYTALHPLLLLTSPFSLIKSAWSGMNMLPYWPSFFFLLFLGCVCFALSSVATSKWNQSSDKPRFPSIGGRINASPGRMIRAISNCIGTSQPKQPESKSDSLVGPFDIIATRANSANTLLWILLLLGAAIFSWMFLQPGRMLLGIGVYSLFPFHIVIKILIASDACRRLNQDRSSGLLELLCVTPEPIEHLPSAYSDRIRSHYFRPAVVLSTLNLLAFVAMYRDLMRQTNMEFDVLLLFILIMGGGIVMLFLDFNALIWVGLKEGLVNRSVNRSIFMTLAKIMGAPWLGLMLLVGFLAGGINPGDSIVFILLWQLASLSYVQSIANKNRRALLSRFRILFAHT